MNQQLSLLHHVAILKQTALRRSRGARSVGIVGAPMTWAHEETGLREPANRASQMRAIDREDLELIAVDATHPAGDFRGLAIRWISVGASIGREPRLAFRELAEGSKREPRVASCPPAVHHRKEKVAHDRYSQNGAGHAVEEHSDLHHCAASGRFIGCG